MVAASLLATARGYPGDARRRKRHKLGKPKTNAFGCVDVGRACRGKNAYCCSGICDGKKPKPGKRDRSRCVGHDAAACQAGQDYCLSGETACGSGGVCLRTTGQASFCGSSAASECLGCTKDAQCVALYGLNAACVVCPNGCANGDDTICVAAAAA
jgi:hypothetical protein